MLYSFVTPSGSIIGYPQEFDTPPALSPLKGRWVVDVVPTYDADMFTPVRVLPVSPDATTIDYTFTPIEFGVAQVLATGMITEQRDREIESGFDYKGKLIDSDRVSAFNIIGASVVAQAAIANNTPYEIVWTCADNTYLTLSAEDVVGLAVALASHTNAAHVKARARKDRVMRASPTTATVLDLMSIVSTP